MKLTKTFFVSCLLALVVQVIFVSQSFALSEDEAVLTQQLADGSSEAGLICLKGNCPVRLSDRPNFNQASPKEVMDRANALFGSLAVKPNEPSQGGSEGSK